MGTKASSNITLAVTGASGTLFARHMLRLLNRDPRVSTVNLVISDAGLRVAAEELGISGRSQLVRQLAGEEAVKVRQQSNDDIAANVASGSYPTDAMIVVPCSMGTLARIANGIAAQLIERAADVCLKEKRPLVLCVREAPLNKIHIRNMWRAADAGATIYPLIPTFYNHPTTPDDMAAQYAARVLAHIGLEPKEMYRWKEKEKAERKR